MKHLGDISKINGAEIEPVDIITFGSPCQDLSVAGKRAGLRHETNGDEETTRSGLFMEAVRIIKEMREATDGKYPRYALWENVPGAFSSNKGEDFRVVLEELIKIAEPSATMPEVPPFGWAYADSYVGDGWSLAYRVFDTQYWPRTPQRRRRIYLVADFGGQCAREILFERKGLRGHLTESPPPRERVTAYVEVGSGTTDCAAWGLTTKGNGDAFLSEERHTALSTGGGQAGQGYPAALVYALDQQGGKGGANYAESVMPTLCSDSHGTPHAVAYSINHQGGNVEQIIANKAGTLTAAMNSSGNNKLSVAYGISSYDSNAMKSANPHSGIYEADTSRTLDLNGGNPACNQGGIAIVEPTAYSMETFHCTTEEEKVQTLKARDWKDPHVVAYPQQAYSMKVIARNGKALVEQANSICASDYKDPDIVAYSVDEKETPIALDRAFYNQGQNAQYTPQYYTDGTVPTLVAKGPAAVCAKYIVRRLTPTECARLQGFSDLWGHPDKKDSFSDEEYGFWLEVRNTHAAINGKAVKEYTKDQMLKWYNKLHSDSAEYKMWGNGIALPPSLYCMQGIEEALKKK